MASTVRSGPRGRVLVVDDEVALLDIFAEALRDAGFEVQAVDGGGTATRLATTEDFDAVVSDVVMPGIGGLQLLRAVRQRNLDTPVILVTGNPSVESAIQAVDEGAFKYLVKPVALEDLRRTVSRAVRMHQLARLKRESLMQLGMQSGPPGDRAGLELAFARSLESLWIAYQPVVRPNGSVYGYEALSRTAEKELVGPVALFDAAERLSRVPELGRTIRRRVAETMAAAATRGTVFLNVHGLELTDESLFSADAPLSKSASRVVLEVSERVALDTVHDARGRAIVLREMGFRLAVDDLGAGYAGLSSLAVLEPDFVKIDASLVRSVDGSPVKRKLIGGLAATCRELGMIVVAEGVETAAERDVVVELGCELLQGRFFGHPGALS
jgi:EAL domain-containing protein (putative c-di-GMP-specific phosphodiesterase class I)